MIDKIIKREFKYIFVNWDLKGYAWVKRELQKMFLKYYYKTNNIESKRLILHNLTVAEISLGTEEDIQLAKKNTEILLNDMNKVHFNRSHPALYCRVLNNYVETHKDELNYEELTKAYEYIYDLTKKSEVIENDSGYLSIKIAKFNLYLHKKDLEVLNIIEEISIHNNNNTEYIETLTQMINDIKNYMPNYHEESKSIITKQHIIIA